MNTGDFSWLAINHSRLVFELQRSVERRRPTIRAPGVQTDSIAMLPIVRFGTEEVSPVYLTDFISIQVLFGVNLHCAQGEVTTLIGRNGMGKTTTVGSILGKHLATFRYQPYPQMVKSLAVNRPTRLPSWG